MYYKCHIIHNFLGFFLGHANYNITNTGGLICNFYYYGRWKPFRYCLLQVFRMHELFCFWLLFDTGKMHWCHWGWGHWRRCDFENNLAREYVQLQQGMHLPKRINILWRLHMCFCDIKNGTIMYAMDVMIVGQGDEGHLGGLFFRWRGTAPRG